MCEPMSYAIQRAKGQGPEKGHHTRVRHRQACALLSLNNVTVSDTSEPTLKEAGDHTTVPANAGVCH